MEEKKQKIFAEGFKFEKPRENSPDFLKGSISIKVPEAIAFLERNQNNAGWVRIDLKKSKEGNLYLELNTWKPKPYEKPVDNGRTSPSEDYPDGINIDDMVF